MDAGLAAVLGAAVGALGTAVTGATAALLSRSTTRHQVRTETLRALRESRRATYASYAKTIDHYLDKLASPGVHAALCSRRRLVGPAEAEHDGGMGEHDQDQGDVAEPARSPLSAEQAREVTAGLREAMDDVQRSVAVLAARVRDAHAAKVWLPLGFTSWEAYCGAEFGISRAQAYRLLDVARALAAIHGAVTAGTETSRTRDTDPATAATLDYGLSQRALITVSARTDVVAELITRRLAALAHSGLTALDEPTVRAVVRQSVRDVRIAPPPPPADLSVDPLVAVGRQLTDDLFASEHAIGELMLEVAPAYLSDTEAATGVLALLCAEIGEPVEHGLAARRYAMSGDRRALHGTVLCPPAPADTRLLL